MKLATYYDGSRDGQLVVVSRDLGLAHYAQGIASRLQQVLDDWNFIAPQLQDLYTTLNHGKARHAFPFEPNKCMAPLPRAGQWAQMAAWPSWLERAGAPLERLAGAADSVGGRAAGKSAGAKGGPEAATAAGTAAAPSSRRGGPPMAQAASDAFWGPCEDAVFPAEATGLDFEAGLLLVTGDLVQGASSAQALEGIRLLSIGLAWRQRGPLPSLAPWEGPAAQQPRGQCAPLLVTPDELGDAWQAGKAALTLHTRVAGRTLGKGLLTDGLGWHAGQCLALMARARPLRAGSLLSLGPVSHADATRGQHSLLERWALDAAGSGAKAASAKATSAKTAGAEASSLPSAPPPFTGLAWGDRVQVDLLDAYGQSLCGAIDTVLSDRDSRDAEPEA
jgi:fumarylacetoacetate (FAA) hydrolase